MDARFSPGFRISATDGIVLIAGTAGTVALSWLDSSLGLVVGLPVVAFFLFCNVFRISRTLELLWAAAFIGLAGATIQWGVPGWWATAGGAALIAAGVVAVEMRRPSYHGVGWQRINPGLLAWWEAQAAKASATSADSVSASEGR